MKADLNSGVLNCTFNLYSCFHSQFENRMSMESVRFLFLAGR